MLVYWIQALVFFLVAVGLLFPFKHLLFAFYPDRFPLYDVYWKAPSRRNPSVRARVLFRCMTYTEKLHLPHLIEWQCTNANTIGTCRGAMIKAIVHCSSWNFCCCFQISNVPSSDSSCTCLFDCCVRVLVRPVQRTFKYSCRNSIGLLFSHARKLLSSLLEMSL